MRFHNITKDDMLNGDGLRVVLWVAGCSHYCRGCQNPITWDPAGGVEFTEDSRREIFELLDKPYISGITFSGGDPLYSGNEKEVTLLAREIREKYPQKTIWLYTGARWEEIRDKEIIPWLDVVVDGEYVEELRDTKLFWRGSSNQRVIDVQATLKSGEIVLHCS